MTTNVYRTARITVKPEAARDIYTNSGAVQRFTGVLYPETLEAVEFTDYRVIAGS